MGEKGRRSISDRHNFSVKESNTYNHSLSAVVEKPVNKILPDFLIHTDRTIAGNFPEITLDIKKDVTVFLIQISIPQNSNILSKERNDQ
jgi:hypothetical protein